MDGLICTRHFRQRFQQRGMSNRVVLALLRYGSASKTRDGAESLFFSKEALAEIKSDYGATVYKACEKQRDTYVILSEDGVLITVARSYRKSIH